MTEIERREKKNGVFKSLIWCVCVFCCHVCSQAVSNPNENEINPAELKANWEFTRVVKHCKNSIRSRLLTLFVPFCNANSWNKQLLICPQICLSSLRLQLSLTARISVYIICLQWQQHVLSPQCCLLALFYWLHLQIHFNYVSLCVCNQLALVHIITNCPVVEANKVYGEIVLRCAVEVLLCTSSDRHGGVTSGYWKIPKKLKRMRF